MSIQQCSAVEPPFSRLPVSQNSAAESFLKVLQGPAFTTLSWPLPKGSSPLIVALTRVRQGRWGCHIDQTPCCKNAGVTNYNYVSSFLLSSVLGQDVRSGRMHRGYTVTSATLKLTGLPQTLAQVSSPQTLRPKWVCG